MAKEKEESPLEEARNKLKDLVDEQETLRTQMKDDLAFCSLDQWPAEIRKERENDPNGARPCLTIDNINQYIVQVANDIRQNRPSIKVRPVDDNADVDTARIYQGLVRHIEDRSNAAVAYAMGAESAIKIGMGYWRITTEVSNSKYNEQEICIKAIPNAFQVYMGPHDYPDGSDAEEAFIVAEIPLKKFKRLYPKAKTEVSDFSPFDKENYWLKEHTITVVERFYCYYEGEVRKIKWCKMTGAEVLEERDWPGKYIPVVEVIGRESIVKGRRILWGLVRPAKDSLRMRNYWFSAVTEKIGLAPKAPFVGAKGQFTDVEQQWKNANRENRAYLEYEAIEVNGNAVPPPQRQAPAPIEAAMIGMTQMLAQEVKSSLGMYKAAVGDTDSQQSGRAILALQKESDTGTMHFADNQAISIRHTGRIVVDLIPKILDTRRVVRILGEDNEVQSVQLDPEQQQAVQKVDMGGGSIKSIYNVGVGEYDVTTTVGPSYTTKRQEVATLFTELANSAKDPASASVMRYIAVKNSDFEQSEEAMKMLKALLPPPLQKLDTPEGQQIPPEVLAKMQQMDEMMGLAAQKIQELESGENVQKMKIQVDQQADAAKQKLKEAEASNNARMEQEAADREAKLAVYKANKEAETKITVARIQANCKLQEAGLNAKVDTDIAFMTGNVEREIADKDREASVQTADADRGADLVVQSAQMEQDGQLAEKQAEQKAEPKSAAGSMKQVVDSMTKMIEQLAQMNVQMMQAQQEQHKELMSALTKPKKVSATLPSGQPMTVTVN
jgi:hypothetical protein